MLLYFYKAFGDKGSSSLLIRWYKETGNGIWKLPCAFLNEEMRMRDGKSA